MRSYNRKSTPRVKAGRVQKKNNWSLSGDYYEIPQPMPVVDRLRPGKGYRHILRQKDIHQFIALLPDWAELSRGLNAIVLVSGDSGADGVYDTGVVEISAWRADLWEEWYVESYEEERDIVERLGVQVERRPSGVLLKWTEGQARAYQLLHVFLHELGHHHDRLTTKPGGRPNRGESYAEMYARRYADQIWERYLRVFEL